MSDSKPERVSFWDTFNSVTGHEELAIEKAFGAEVGDLTQKTFSGSMSLVALRAMVFVLEQRKGNASAFDAAMSLTRAELAERFLSDEEEAEDAIPDEPDTELGKDGSEPG